MRELLDPGDFSRRAASRDAEDIHAKDAYAEDARPDGVAPRREVHDRAHDVRWRIFEFVARTQLAPPRPRALLADGGKVLRRIEAFPADWYALSDEALLALVDAPPGPPRFLREGSSLPAPTESAPAEPEPSHGARV